MATGTGKFWLIATFLLIATIVVSSLVIATHRGQGQTIDILPPQPSNFSGEIYVGGAINSPGVFPLQEDDSITGILQASGGLTNSADLKHIRLYIPQVGENQQTQKVDVNRADVWLLEALPDIGNTRAQAIVSYRQQKGSFHNIEEIVQVPGISRTTFEKIKDLITVAD